MKQSLRIAGVLSLVMMFGAVEAMAQGRGRGNGRGRGMGAGVGAGQGRGAGMMMQNLGPELQAQIFAMRASHRAKMASTRATLDVKRAEMRVLWVSNKPSRKAILDKHAEMNVLRQNLREARVDFRLSVHKLLSPEQRAMFFSKRGNAWGGKGGKGGRAGRGMGGGWGQGAGWGQGNR